MRRLPAPLVDAIAGDLREGYARRVAGGRMRAAAWYWAQVLTFRYGALGRAADRAYGGAGRRRARLLSGWPHDLRLGVRSVWKHRALSALVVGTLGLGIGATTAVYGVVDGVLLRPLPYPGSERLVDVWSTYLPWRDSDNPLMRMFSSSAPSTWDTYEAWRSGARSIEAIGAYRPEQVTVSGGERPERVEAVFATAGVFAALGTRPALGRGISTGDDRPGGPALAVLSHEYWQSSFGGDRAVLGRTLRIDDGAYTVVGVMPRGFYFPDPDYRVWLTFSAGARERSSETQMLQAVALLRPGTSLSDAQRDFDAVMVRLDEARETERGEWGARVASRLDEVVGDTRPILLVLLGAAALVLAVASANVVNLLLVRATSRRRELAVRAALGADRGRLVRALMSESLVLSLLGGVAGALLAAAALPVIAAHLPASIPRATEIAPDARVFAFAAAVTLLSAVAAGIGPAWAGAGHGLSGILRDEARGSVGSRAGRRTRAALVVAEVALAFLLLAATGVLARSLMRLNAVDPGFERAHLVAARLHLPPHRTTDAAAAVALATRLREKVAALHGVAMVATAQEAPFAGGMSAGTITIAGANNGADLETSVGQSVVSDGYFEAMGIPVVNGRSFAATDAAGAEPVAIVSRAMAERFWPGRSPIGARVRDGGEADPWLTVVGVVGDVRQAQLEEPPTAYLYKPLAQVENPALDQVLLARTVGDATPIAAALSGAIAAVDRDIAISRVAHMAELVARSTAVPRFRTLLVAALACLAAALALAGLYGVLAYTVALATAEIGVRIALGARPARILRDVVRRGVTLALAGIAIGGVVAMVALRALDRFLFDTGATDPPTLLAIAVLLVATAVAAALVPARRAARVHPLDALRID